MGKEVWQCAFFSSSMIPSSSGTTKPFIVLMRR